MSIDFSKYNYNNHPGADVLSAIRTGHVERSGTKVTDKGIAALVNYCESYNIDLPKGYESYGTSKPAVQEEPAGSSFVDKIKSGLSNIANSFKNDDTEKKFGDIGEDFNYAGYDAFTGVDVKPREKEKSFADATMEKYGVTNEEKAVTQTAQNDINVAPLGDSGYDAFSGLGASPKINIEEHADASPGFKNAAMAYNAEAGYVDKVKNTYEFNRLNVAYAYESYKFMNGQDNNMAEMKAQVEAYAQSHPEIFQDNEGLLGEMGLASAEMMPFMVETMKGGAEMGMAGAVGAGSAAALAGQMGPQVATPEEIITVPGAAAVGFKMGSTMGSAMASYQLEAGFAYADMIEQGIPADIASQVATYVGLANAGIEVAQVGTISKKLPVVGKVLSAGISEGAEEVAQKYIRNSSGKTIMSGLKEFAKDIASETAEEVAQETTNIIGETVAQKRMGNKNYTPFTAENGARLVQTATQTLKAMPIMVGPGNVMSTTSTLNRDYKIKQAEGELSNQISQVLAVNTILPAEISIEENEKFVEQLHNIVGSTDVQSIRDIAAEGVDKTNLSLLTGYGRVVNDVVIQNDVSVITDDIVDIQERGLGIIEELKKSEKAEEYQGEIALYEGVLKSLDDLVVDGKKVETGAEIDTALANSEKKRKQEAVEMQEAATTIIEEAQQEEISEQKQADGWIETKTYGWVKVVDDSGNTKIKIQNEEGTEIEIGRKAFEKMAGKKVEYTKAKEPEISSPETTPGETKQDLQSEIDADAKKVDADRQTSQENKQAEGKVNDTPGEVKKDDLNTKFGRAGNAAFKKWSNNEWIMADLNDTSKERTQNWIKLFNMYYDRGFNDQGMPGLGEHSDLEVDFPPFVFDEIFKAGEKDREAKLKREAKKKEKEESNEERTSIQVDGHTYSVGDELHLSVEDGAVELVDIVSDSAIKVKTITGEILGTNPSAILNHLTIDELQEAIDENKVRGKMKDRYKYLINYKKEAAFLETATENDLIEMQLLKGVVNKNTNQIVKFYKEDHRIKEKVEFIKDYFGSEIETSMPISKRYRGLGYQRIDSTGITFDFHDTEFTDKHEVRFYWPKITQMYEELVKSGKLDYLGNVDVPAKQNVESDFLDEIPLKDDKGNSIPKDQIIDALNYISEYGDYGDKHYNFTSGVANQYLDMLKERGYDITPKADENLNPDSESGIIEPKKDISKYQQLADVILEKLKQNEKINVSDLYLKANDIFGGKMSDNVYNIKDLYDAMELAVNQFILESDFGFPSNSGDAKLVLKNIEAMLDEIPTQTKRTDEMVKLQQFSTPPNIAYIVNWLANVTENDAVLEPSAGTGSLAIWGKKAGAKVFVNEISDRRNEILHQLPFDGYYTENAEQINNILPADVKPSVVVMNPPFSATTRMTKNATVNAKKHIEQALKRLQPDGRLVVLTGNGMAQHKKTFSSWWKDIKKEYDVKANVTVDGKNYRKYGTNYDIQLIVIDKTGPTTERTITKPFGDLEALIGELGGLRDERRIPNQEAQGDRRSNEASTEPVSNGEVPGQEMDNGATSANSTGESSGTGRVGQTKSQESSDSGVSGAHRNELGTGQDIVDVHGGRRGPGSVSNDTDINEGLQEPSRVDGPSTELSDRADGTTGVVRQSQGMVDESSVKTSNKKKKKKKSSSKDLKESIFENYVPAKLKIDGAKEHPSVLAESAAMSAVEPPNVTYSPSLDKKLINDGDLSLAQLEAVVYAGQAHEQMLQDGTRKGFFIGDGTGVGKGREITGIILDNYNKGRKKAVWMTVNKGLFKDAARDLKDLNYPSEIIGIDKIKKGTNINFDEGVLMTTYSTMSGGFKDEVTINGGDYGKPILKQESRIKQLYDWLGPDYDGVIAFDEAHKMKSAVPSEGKRGKAKPSDIGQTGLVLNKLFPNARIVYVSATGATEVSNLAYAQRLGLWGEGTSFQNVNEFIESLEKGGISAMELVARDMKAMGVYLARALSFDGVSYGRKEHKLNKTQKKTYDKMAEAWNIVLDNVYKAIEDNETNSKARGQALSKFWGANQRFFNQVVTSFKMPTIVEEIRKSIDAGNSVVLQTISTYEAATNRKISLLDKGMTLEDLDMSPRETLIDFLEKSFPVQQFEEVEDEYGNVNLQPVVDAEGKPVLNAESVATRDKLIEDLATLPVPDDPMSMLFEAFGHDEIAEVSGRDRRIVYDTDEYGNKKRVLQKRKKSASDNDARLFNEGKKRILIFTKAGGTGFSFHASNKFENQQKRIHILLEGGYSADDAIQGFGRTHRSNEKHKPHYLLVTTDIAGEKRFISTIAKRLDQLGALTKGQRQTGSTGVFSASDNIESDYAKDGLQQLYKDLANNNVAGYESETTFKKLGMQAVLDENGNLNEKSDDLRDISRFLNRILATPMDFQNKLFEQFENKMDTFVARAMEDGTFDVGMENLKADSVEISEKHVAKTYEGTDAKTEYVKLKTGTNTKKRSFNEIKTEQKKFKGFYVNKISGNIRAVFGTNIVRTDGNGNQSERLKILGQADYQDGYMSEMELNANENWESLKDHSKAQKLWDEKFGTVPDMKYKDVHMITGAILPIWKRLPSVKSRIMRTITDDGEQLLGRIVDKKHLPSTLAALEMKIDDSGKAKEAEKVNVADAIQEIMDKGNYLMLNNGDWKIAKKRVSNETRFELTGKDIFVDEDYLKQMGIFKEMIQYRARYFIPTSNAVEITQKLVDKYGFKGMTSTVDNGLNGPAFNKIESNTFQNAINTNKSIDEIKADAKTYEKAKNGNMSAAARLVVKNIDKENLQQLAINHPHAFIVPVMDADNSKNAIPLVLANTVSEISNLNMDLSIIKENSHKDSKMSALERMADKPVFTGLVVPGREYIITDDVFTMGSTINELKRFIEDNGGIVADVVTLSQSKNGNNLNVIEETKAALDEKFNLNELENVLKEGGVINDSIEELTEGEAKQLQKLKNLDSIRTKIPARQVGERFGTGEETHKKRVEESKEVNNYGAHGKSMFHEVIEGLAANGKKDEIKSFNKMISELAKHFKLPVDTRGFRKRKATGYYEVIPKTVRIKYDNDIEVVMHEIGHHLDHEYELQELNHVAIEEMVDNLPDAFKENYKDDKLPGEAIAEFFKMYIVDPKAAKEFGSAFYDLFEGALEPKDLKAVQAIQQDMADFTNSSLDDMFGSTMVSYTEDTDNRSFKDKKKYVGMKMHALLFEDKLGLKNVADYVANESGKELDPSENPYILALHTNRAQAIAAGMIGGIKSGAATGMIGPHSNLIDDRNLADVLAPISDNEKEFSVYLKNKHAQDLMGMGHRVYSPQFTIDMVNNQVEKAELAHPEFKETAEELYSWWNKFMEAWMVDTGFINRASWEKMLELYPHYVPMLRVDESYTVDPKGNIVRTKSKKGIGSQSAPIHRLSHSGSGLDTYNPLESMVLQMFKIVDAQMKREVMLSMHDLYTQGTKGIGEFYHKINRPMEYHSYDARELKNSMAIGFLNDYFAQNYQLDLSDKQLSSLLFGADRTREEIENQLMLEGVDMEKLHGVLADIKDKLLENAKNDLSSSDIIGDYLDDKYTPIDVMERYIDNTIEWFTPSKYSKDDEVLTVVDRFNNLHFYKINDRFLHEALTSFNAMQLDGFFKAWVATKRIFTDLITSGNPVFGVLSNLPRDIQTGFIQGHENNPVKYAKELGESAYSVLFHTEANQMYRILGGGFGSSVSGSQRNMMKEVRNKMGFDESSKGAKVLMGLEKFNDAIESAPRQVEFFNVYNEATDKGMKHHDAVLKALYESSDVTLNFMKRGQIMNLPIAQVIPFFNAGLQGLDKLYRMTQNKETRKVAFLKAVVTLTLPTLAMAWHYRDDEDYKKISKGIRDNYWLFKYAPGKFIRIAKPRELAFIFSTLEDRMIRAFSGEEDPFEKLDESFMNVFIPPVEPVLITQLMQVAMNKSWTGAPIVPYNLQNKPLDYQYDDKTSNFAIMIGKAMPNILGPYSSPKNIDYLIDQLTGIVGDIVLPLTTPSEDPVKKVLTSRVTTDVAYSNDAVNNFYEIKEKLDEAASLFKSERIKTENYNPVAQAYFKAKYKAIGDYWDMIRRVESSKNYTDAEKEKKIREYRIKIAEYAQKAIDYYNKRK